MLQSFSRDGADKQMKVLCLGLGRTGTISLGDALMTLGYHHTYHTFDCVSQPACQDARLWYEFMCAKVDGQGKVPGREEFDEILGHCQAVTDMPAAFFAAELVKAYPDAKVILNTRDVESWYISASSTLYTPKTWIGRWIVCNATLLRMPSRWLYRMSGKLEEALYDNDFEKNRRAAFENHHVLVRSIVPPENLLEYNIKQGWKPLCDFLGKPIPDEDIPKLNTTDDYLRSIVVVGQSVIASQVRRIMEVSAYSALAVVVVTATWQFATKAAV